MTFKVGDFVSIKDKIHFISSEAPRELKEWVIGLPNNEFRITSIKGVWPEVEVKMVPLGSMDWEHPSFFYPKELELTKREWD